MSVRFQPRLLAFAIATAILGTWQGAWAQLANPTHVVGTATLGPISTGRNGKVQTVTTTNGPGETSVTDWRSFGVPKNFTIEKSDSLGMIMITATGRQLGGKLTIKDLAPGTEFCLELPGSLEESPA